MAFLRYFTDTVRQPKLTRLAERTLKEGRFADAIYCANEGLKLDHTFAPHTVTLLYIKTIAEFRLNRIEQAKQSWRIILKDHTVYFPEEYQWKLLEPYLSCMAAELIEAVMNYKQRFLNHRIALTQRNGRDGQNYWFFESQKHHSREAMKVPADVIGNALRIVRPETLPFTLECYYLSSGDGGDTRELLYDEQFTT